MNEVKSLSNLLKILGDPTRLRILEILHRRGESCVCELEALLDMTQSNISFHLNALKAVNLVTDEKVGRWVFYTLNEPVLQNALGALQRLFAPERAGQERSLESVFAQCLRGEYPPSRAEVLASAMAASPEPA